MGSTDKFRVVDVAVDGDDLDDLRQRKRTGMGAVELDARGNPLRETRRRLAPKDVLSRLLPDERLSLDEGAPGPGNQRKIAPNPGGLRKGYDPYESGLLAKKERHKKRDLRALSAWIEARKRADSAKE
jgi:hypothetical protein